MSAAIPYAQKPKNRKLTLLLLVVSVLAATAALTLPRVLKRAEAPPVSVAAPAIKTVVAGEAGTVGDLTITPEALALAEIKTAPVTRKLVSDTIAVSGVVQAGGDSTAKVTSRVRGKVTKIFVVSGDSVRAGATLAVVESGELAQAQGAYKQAVAQLLAAEVNLQRQKKLAQLGAFGRPRVEDARKTAVGADNDEKTAESEIAGAKAALRQAKTAADVAESRFKRANLLLKEELISRQEWEETAASNERAKADIQAAEALVASALTKRDGARRRGVIAKEALSREEAVYAGGFTTSKEIVEAESSVRQANLDVQAASQAIRLLGSRPGGGSEISLVTPIAGQVQDRSVSLGEMVDTEHPLFTVVNLDAVWAQLAVSPRDLGNIHLGQPVELTSETAPGRTFRGKISSIGSATDATTRAIPVRVSLLNTGLSLRPGTFLRGGVVTNTRHNRITVPDAAIQEHTGKKTLYVALGDGGAFEVRHIVLGAAGDGWTEVKGGLKGDERIAVNGTFYLKSEALKSSLSDGCCAVDTGKE